MSASIVFVSYAREDGTFVAALSEGLEATEAVRIVGDFNEIDFSEAWKARISQLIASAEMVFFIASPASVASEVCRWELHTAETVGAAITPIFFRAAAHGEVPESLARRHGFSVEALGAAYVPILTVRRALAAAARANDANRVANVQAELAREEATYRARLEATPGFASLVEAAAAAVTAPTRLWRRRRAQWSQRADHWVQSGRAPGRLLRAAEIAEVDALAVEAPAGESPAPALIAEFLEASRAREAAVAEERRQVVERGFVDPARRLAKDGAYDAALRRIATAAILAEDPDLLVDLANVKPNDAALWRIAALVAPLASHRIIAVQQYSHPYQVALLGVRPALSPSGAHLVIAAGFSGDPRVLRTSDYSEVARLPHDHDVATAIWPVRSDYFFTAGGDHQVGVWRGDDFSRVALPPISGIRIEPETISADGRRLLVYVDRCDSDGKGVTVCWTWRETGLEEVSRFGGQSPGFAACAISPDGALAASPGPDGASWIWHVETGEALQRLEPSTVHNALMFSPDSSSLVSRSIQGKVTTWRLGDDPTPLRWPDGDYDFLRIADDESCFVATSGGDVRLHNTADGKKQSDVMKCGAQLRGFGATSDLALIVAGCNDSTAKIYRRRDGLIASEGATDGLLPLACFDGPPFRILGVDSKGGEIALYDCGTNRILWRTTAPSAEGQSAHVEAVLSEDSALAAIIRCSIVQITDLLDGRLVAERDIGESVRGVAFSVDNEKIVISDRMEYTFAYAVADFKKGKVFRPNNDYEVAESFRFSPDGTVGYAGLKNRELVAHDGATGRQVHNYGKTRGPIERIAICADGARVMVAYANGSADVLDVETGVEISRLNLQDLSMISTAEFFANGSKALLAPGGGVSPAGARIFDVETGAMLYELPQAFTNTACAALSQDETQVLVVAASGQWRIYDISWLDAFNGDRATYLAAALDAGVGLKTAPEAQDLMMQDAPDDVFSAYVTAIKARRTEGALAEDMSAIEATLDTEIARASWLLRSRGLTPVPPEHPAG